MRTVIQFLGLPVNELKLCRAVYRAFLILLTGTLRVDIELVVKTKASRQPRSLMGLLDQRVIDNLRSIELRPSNARLRGTGREAVRTWL